MSELELIGGAICVLLALPIVVGLIADGPDYPLPAYERGWALIRQAVRGRR